MSWVFATGPEDQGFIPRAIGVMRRLFVNGPGYQGSIPGRVLLKTPKVILDTTLYSSRYYMVRINGKVEPSREWGSALPYPRVL